MDDKNNQEENDLSKISEGELIKKITKSFKNTNKSTISPLKISLKIVLYGDKLVHSSIINFIFRFFIVCQSNSFNSELFFSKS